MKIFHIINLTLILSLLIINIEIFKLNDDINLDYYDCTINEFTHKKENYCKNVCKGLTEYDIGCHTYDIWLKIKYDVCKLNKDCYLWQ